MQRDSRQGQPVLVVHLVCRRWTSVALRFVDISPLPRLFFRLSSLRIFGPETRVHPCPVDDDAAPKTCWLAKQPRPAVSMSKEAYVACLILWPNAACAVPRSRGFRGRRAQRSAMEPWRNQKDRQRLVACNRLREDLLC